MKALLLKYAVGSSIFFHVALAIALVWLLPLMRSSYEAGMQWAQPNGGEIGVIQDVSVIQQDGYEYRSYAIRFREQVVYVYSGEREFSAGEQVSVSVMKHPYSPLKTLMVVLSESRS